MTFIMVVALAFRPFLFSQKEKGARCYLPRAGCAGCLLLFGRLRPGSGFRTIGRCLQFWRGEHCYPNLDQRHRRETQLHWGEEKA
jgi:hypothetical protein